MPMIRWRPSTIGKMVMWADYVEAMITIVRDADDQLYTARIVDKKQLSRSCHSDGMTTIDAARLWAETHAGRWPRLTEPIDPKTMEKRLRGQRLRHGVAPSLLRLTRDDAGPEA